LALHFGGPGALARVILVDNDAHKALPAEAGNMVLVPTWAGPPPSEGSAAPGAAVTAGAAAVTPPGAPPSDPDTVLVHLADAMLDPATGLSTGDVRTKTAGVAARVAAAAALTAAGLGAHVPTTADLTRRPPGPADPLPVSAPGPTTTSGGGGGDAAAAAHPPGVDTPPLAAAGGSPLPDERTAWATAVALAVSELGAARAASLSTIWTYARFRAPGATVQAVLTKQAVKETVAALRTGGDGAAVVPAVKLPGARVLAAKHLKLCYSLSEAGVRRLPEGGVAAAVDRLRAAVDAAGIKPGPKKAPTKSTPKRKRKDGGSAADPLTATVEDVVLACIADLTAVSFFHAPFAAHILAWPRTGVHQARRSCGLGWGAARQ
jgi:hypothetical protein